MKKDVLIGLIGSGLWVISIFMTLLQYNRYIDLVFVIVSVIWLVGSVSLFLFMFNLYKRVKNERRNK